MTLSEIKIKLALDDEAKRLLARLEELNGSPADPESPTWPYVRAFARLMEAKLAANRHKGNAEGWRKDTAQALFARLDQELDELKAAWAEGRLHEVPDEAADVANFALMIADIFGGLHGQPGVERHARAPAVDHVELAAKPEVAERSNVIPEPIASKLIEKLKAGQPFRLSEIDAELAGERKRDTCNICGKYFPASAERCFCGAAFEGRLNHVLGPPKRVAPAGGFVGKCPRCTRVPRIEIAAGEVIGNCAQCWLGENVRVAFVPIEGSCG